MRRYVQIAGWTLIWSGVLIFSYLGWELVGTDLVNSRTQTVAAEELVGTFEDVREELPEAREVTATVPDEEGSVEEKIVVHYEEPVPAEGEGFARMIVDKIGLDAVVFQGVDPATLRLGPGHMSHTPLPGQPGNAVISGHRTTYGAPFFDLDQLEPGDIIEVETAIGVHRYEVRESLVVTPNDWWVTEEREGAWLTLTTCHPKFSARQRLIVVAELVDGPNLDYVRLLEGRLEDLT